MVPKSWWWTGLIGLMLVALLPVAGSLLRTERTGRCAWDGLKIDPLYQVRVVEESGATKDFCCLRCAELWLERRGDRPLRILVTDETTGMEFDAAEANYVRSTVLTNEVTGNRRHVFRDVEAALKHAEAARGRRLLGDEKPFAKMNETRPDAPTQ